MKKHHLITIIATLALLLVSAQIALADSNYTVSAGDTLGKIAERFGIGQQEIINANTIANPDWIYVGQELLIPDGSIAAEAAVPEAQAEAVVTPAEVAVAEEAPATDAPIVEAPAVVAPIAVATTYNVQAGDTLSRIALRFGVDMWALANTNGISNPALIYVGQALTIPGVNANAMPAVAAPLTAGWTPMPSTAIEGEKWIDVNLTTQTLVAYEGNTPVYQSLISSGLPQYSTVTGQFRIWLRYESQTMNGLALGFDYYTENVPHVMYFYGNFAIHGAFWHNDFGTAVSHGCVNTPLHVAEWLFNWASNGTLVNVHY